eukprot:425413-Pyramimonas_sp.AAC.1
MRVATLDGFARASTSELEGEQDDDPIPRPGEALEEQRGAHDEAEDEHKADINKIKAPNFERCVYLLRRTIRQAGRAPA